jgi:regulator of RNase E activity RraA
MPLDPPPSRRSRASRRPRITTILLKKGLRNVWMRGTRPLSPGHPRIVGPAFTLRFVPAAEDLATPASWSNPFSTRSAIEAMPAGCVAGGRRDGHHDAGIFGDILVRAHGQARRRGARDRRRRARRGGGSRNWAARVVPGDGRAAFGRGPHVVAWDQPIGCGGVAVFPNDVVVVDDDGAVLIPAALLDQVVADAIEQERSRSGSWARSRTARPCRGCIRRTPKPRPLREDEEMKLSSDARGVYVIAPTPFHPDGASTNRRSTA